MKRIISNYKNTALPIYYSQLGMNSFLSLFHFQAVNCGAIQFVCPSLSHSSKDIRRVAVGVIMSLSINEAAKVRTYRTINIKINLLHEFSCLYWAIKNLGFSSCNITINFHSCVINSQLYRITALQTYVDYSEMKIMKLKCVVLPLFFNPKSFHRL